MLWGFGTIILVFGAGLFFTIRIKSFNIIHIVHIFKSTLFVKNGRKKEENGSISQFQALSTALAASMGTGNIVGVAAAISVGGPGAIFWMWVSAIFCTAIAFGENVLGVRYKNRGGCSPMSYISEAIHPKAAILYAAVCVLASFGIGNMTQTNALASAAAELGISYKAAGLVTALLCGLFIFRGAKKVAAAAEKIIPFISLLYIGASLIVIVIFRNNIAEVLKSIIGSAIGYSQVIGGISGTAIKRAVSVGLRRGIFSNEAGMGSSVLVHTETDCKEPVQMGMWAVAEVVMDTIICCSLTAFVILLTGADSTGGEGLAVAAEGFRRGLGDFAGYFTAGSAVIFAFCTLLGWYFYGEKCLLYIVRTGNKKTALFFYRAAYTAAAFIGAVSSLDIIWGTADIFNWILVVINLAAVIILNGEIVESTKKYTNSIIKSNKSKKHTSPYNR